MRSCTLVFALTLIFKMGPFHRRASSLPLVPRSHTNAIPFRPDPTLFFFLQSLLLPPNFLQSSSTLSIFPPLAISSAPLAIARLSSSAGSDSQVSGPVHQSPIAAPTPAPNNPIGISSGPVSTPKAPAIPAPYCAPVRAPAAVRPEGSLHPVGCPPTYPYMFGQATVTSPLLP